MLRTFVGWRFRDGISNLADQLAGRVAWKSHTKVSVWRSLARLLACVVGSALSATDDVEFSDEKQAAFLNSASTVS